MMYIVAISDGDIEISNGNTVCSLRDLVNDFVNDLDTMMTDDAAIDAAAKELANALRAVADSTGRRPVEDGR